MQLRRLLDKAGDLSEELKYIDYKIVKLQLLGTTMIDCDFKKGDIILETLPNNGARPIITPLYPMTYPPKPLEMVIDDNTASAETPQPIGFQRVYVPSELKETGLLTVFMEVDRITLLAMIDTTIAKLKERKKQIFSESRALIEKPR